jgi:hypothetical protein
MHQVKSTLNGYKGKTLTVIVEREQEAINLEEIAKYRNISFSSAKKNDSIEVVLGL